MPGEQAEASTWRREGEGPEPSEMLDVEECKEPFPGYAWGRPRGPRLRVTLPDPPTLLGRRKKENDKDKRDTTFVPGVHLFAPVVWYSRQLR